MLRFKYLVCVIHSRTIIFHETHHVKCRKDYQTKNKEKYDAKSIKFFKVCNSMGNDSDFIWYALHF